VRNKQNPNVYGPLWSNEQCVEALEANKKQLPAYGYKGTAVAMPV
jgi:hypothetical protein